MILPGNTILYLIAIVGIVFYYAAKGNGKKNKEKNIYDIYREIGENSSEYSRYQQWFEEHQE